jgi:hypothetical protein
MLENQDKNTSLWTESPGFWLELHNASNKKSGINSLIFLSLSLHLGSSGREGRRV